MVTSDHETGYLAGPDADAEKGWTALTGAEGQLPNVSWDSGGDTNVLVPVYAKDAGSEVLTARATNWDFVRGAYLDNADLGKAIFDALGHADAEGDAVDVEASVPLRAQAGQLSLAVSATDGPVTFAGDAASQQADLPEVVVNDSRNEAQAQGRGWALSGSASAFVAGNRSFGAENLSWDPEIVRTATGAAAGGAATLDKSAILADAGRVERVGETVGADLALTIPATAESGRYGSEITLTLFAKD
jgi:alkaline phosphatase